MTRTDDFTVYRFIIIGGGAAGLYAGAIAGFFHPDLPKKHCGLILERGTEPGRKLIITGSGQCNLTHSGSIKDFPAHYHEAGRKIRTLLYAHSNQRVVSTFSDMGIKTFEREDGKIFPESLSARKVRDTLSERCSKNGFPILTGMKCTELIPLHRKSINRGARWKIICGEQEFRARNVLVTTGGASVPKTGSDGSFLKILERLTIPVSPLTPALVPVSVQKISFPRPLRYLLSQCRNHRL